MIKVLVTTDPRYRANRKHIRSIVSSKLQTEGIEGNVEVSVAVVGARKMRAVTKEFMGKEEDHNVLSFPFEDPSANKEIFANAPDNVMRLGDIILCHPIVVSEAAEDDVLVSEKIAELLEHSTNHLLGKHHEALD